MEHADMRRNKEMWSKGALREQRDVIKGSTGGSIEPSNTKYFKHVNNIIFSHGIHVISERASRRWNQNRLTRSPTGGMYRPSRECAPWRTRNQIVFLDPDILLVESQRTVSLPTQPLSRRHRTSRAPTLATPGNDNWGNALLGSGRIESSLRNCHSSCPPGLKYI